MYMHVCLFVWERHSTKKNLEYQVRREWIAEVAPESRVRELFVKYQCFNSYEKDEVCYRIYSY